MVKWLLRSVVVVWLGLILWAALLPFQFSGPPPQLSEEAEAWCDDNTVEVSDAAIDLGLIDESEVDDTVDALVAIGNMEARRPTDYNQACQAAFASRSR